ncbi:MAG: aminopeptidase [Lactobacillaceae bacterium]|jgi:aminopeptidase|nr:aminopeptidase [Lactobacillaceae bacterium]
MQFSPEIENKIDKYAQLAVKKGVHVVPGQTIIFYVNTELDYFAEKLVKEAYALGAAEVYVEWSNTSVTRSFLENAADDRITEVPEYKKVWSDSYILDKKASRVSVISSDPDGLGGVDSKRLAANTKALSQALQVARKATMNDDISWLVMAAPGLAWAEKVFPELQGREAIERLWEEFFKDVYVDEESDAIENWESHIHELKKRADWLNEQNFKELRYKSAKTDATIGLAENHNWEAALSEDKQGNVFIPNMPTEEVFTAPDNRNISGTIASTLPLSYNGNLITDILLTVVDGKITEAHASKGEEVLQELIATDEGSHSFGEVSLVPFHSPISQSGVLFYNTLYDENASDHLAIGGAYSSNIKNGKTTSEDELVKFGWNRSDVHVDFMIGSEDMNIDGVTFDGQVVPVFRNGDWASEI